jgi:small GTP-binding protein
MAEYSQKILYKIVVIGDGGIGKSTMIQRLITGNYIPMKITIGTDLFSYSTSFDDILVKLQIWDFAGEQRFRFFLPNYARGAHGCLLCYDITRFTSFDHLSEWYDIIRNNAPLAVVILVGEKLDLANIKRTVRKEDAQQFQEEHGISSFFETSSVSGYNNDIIFETLAKLILEKRK